MGHYDLYFHYFSGKMQINQNQCYATTSCCIIQHELNLHIPPTLKRRGCVRVTICGVIFYNCV